MKTPKSRGERTRPSGLLRIAAVLVLLSVLSAVRVRAGLDTSGWWSDKSPELKGNAIHLAVLPGSPNAAWDASLNHSYVVWWRGRDHQCTTATNDSLIGGLWGFKPWRGTSTSSDPLQGLTMLPFGTTDVDIFCSGATALPGAKLLIGGGAMAENNGITASYVFDPSASAANQFTRFSASSEMTHPRWYPTLTVDQNGDARVFAGLKFNHMLNVMGLSGATSAVIPHVNRYLVSDRPIHDNSVLPAPDASTNQSPDARQHHAMAIWVKGGISDALMIGGAKTDGSNLNVLDQWVLRRGSGDGGEDYRWVKPTQSGITGTSNNPGSVSMHTLCATAANKYFLIGGWNGSSANDLGVVYRITALDDKNLTWNWEKMTTSGPIPSPRFDHCATYDELNDRIYVFGGVKDDQNVQSSYCGVDTLWALTNLTSDHPTWIATAWTSSSSIRAPQRRGAVMVAEPFQNSHVHHTATGTVHHDERRFFVYGGRNWNGELAEQAVWELTAHGDLGSDPASRTTKWRALGSSNVGPGGRDWYSMTYNLNTQELVVSGGRGKPNGPALRSTWVMPVAVQVGAEPTGDDSAACRMPNDWRLAADSSSSEPVIGAAAVYDPTPVDAKVAERFTASQTKWSVPDTTTVAGHAKKQENYPQMFLLPGGRMFYAGPDNLSAVYDPSAASQSGAGAWTYQPWTLAQLPYPTNDHVARGGSAVLYRVTADSAYIMKCGARDNDGDMRNGQLTQTMSIAYNGTTGAYTYSPWDTVTGGVANLGSAKWMASRCNFNLVLLPNGKTMVLGGLDTNEESGNYDDLHAEKRPQI